MNVKSAVLVTTALLSLSLAGPMAYGQTGPQAPGDLWGPPIRANDTGEVLRAVGDQLGMIRGRQLYWQQLNAIEFTANGSMVDLEAGSIGALTPVSKYTYSASYQIPASRLDIEGPGRDRVVRVVRGDLDQAWNENRPGYVDGPSNNAAFREQQIWLWPHAFARAAAYAEQGRCPDGSECNVPLNISRERGQTVVKVTIAGTEYKATLGEDNRPARIEATLDVPGVGFASYVANYSGYRNGLGLGATGETVGEGVRGLPAASDSGAARGQGILDKSHTGTYFAGRIVHEVNGRTVLDLETTEVWPNAFMIFPTPDLLASAQ